MKKFNPFQFRWNEPLGRPECPYARRWVFNFGLFAIRLHVWYRSDDKRFFHNHPVSFITFVLRGSYTDVALVNGKEVRDHLKRFSVRYRPATHLHYVEVPKGGAATLLLTSWHKQNWGFWVNNRILRPLRYFHRYGHPICDDQ